MTTKSTIHNLLIHRCCIFRYEALLIPKGGSLGGCYEKDFVELMCDSPHTIPGHKKDLKVFLSPRLIQEDSDSVGYHIPDQR